MAQDIEHKRSVLDDDASIYQKKEEREESKTVKERWATMNAAEKKQYFKDYMLKPILFGGFIILLIIYFLYTSFRDGKSTKFYLIVLNQYYLDNKAMEEHLDSLEDFWQLSKREQAVYSTELTLNDSASLSTFVTYLYAGTINAAIGTKEQLEQYGYHFVNLKEELPEAVLAQIPEEAFCELKYETVDPDAEKPVVNSTYSAIYLKYTIFADNLNKDITVDEDELILVIAVAGLSNYKDGVNYSYDFLKYALGLDLNNEEYDLK